MFWGFVLFFVLPPDPVRAKGFKPKERYIMVARLESNNSGVRNTHLKGAQVVELLMDPKFWLMFSWAFLGMIANGKLNFTSSDHPVVLLTILLFRCDLNIHSHHHQRFWLQYSTFSAPLHACWCVRRYCSIAFTLFGIQNSKHTLLVSRCWSTRNNSCFIATMVAPTQRSWSFAFRLLHSSLDRSGLCCDHGSSVSQHCRIHKANCRFRWTLHRILSRYDFSFF